MEDRGSERNGKRIREDDDEDDNLTLASTQAETPDFFRVFLKALEMDVCPYLKSAKGRITLEELRGNWLSLFPKILSEELLSRFRSSNPGTLVGRSVVVPPLTSSPPRMPESGRQELQLCVSTRIPAYIFSGDNIKGEGGSVIYVFLKDPSDGSVVKTGSASAANLNVVVLHGDFNQETSDGWKHDIFESRRVEEREGKRPLLVGTLRVKLKDGVGILGDVSFTDNSSWIPSKSFRLGFALASGFCGEIRVMEAKTNAFRVKDGRGKPYKKHYPPALHDKVWRLTNISKDGKLDKRLAIAEIRTVEDLLQLHANDRQKLRTILGKGMTEAMWETTIKHAMTCSPPADKNSGGTNSGGSLGFITDTQVAPLPSLDQTQKLILPQIQFLQKSRVEKTYENRVEVVELDNQFLSSITTSKEMQDCPDSINHNIIPTQTGQTFHSDRQIQASAPQQYLEPPFSSSNQEKRYLRSEWTGLEDLNGERLWSWLDFRTEHNMVSGSPSDSEAVFDRLNEAEMKAVVGWLKIKAVLKWGMMVSIAAKKKAKLTQLD